MRAQGRMDRSDADAQLQGCGMDDDEELTIDQWLALDDSGVAIGDGVQHGSESEHEDEWSTSSEDESVAPAGAEEAFEAEKVCNVRREGVLQALVEWSGSNGGVPWARSWEPLENLGPGLQWEATVIWEKKKAARRKRGVRNRSSVALRGDASRAGTGDGRGRSAARGARSTGEQRQKARRQRRGRRPHYPQAT